VLDFGLVVADRKQPEGSNRLTVEGAIAGTPAYMAPESVVGETDVDHHADIYALGCVGYWLLTGELVFAAATPMAMALAHARDEPVPPSQRTELAIPAELEKAIIACLSKQPGDRPSANELAALLDACEVEEWTQRQAQDWWELHSGHEGE